MSKDMSPLMTVQTLRGRRSFPDAEALSAADRSSLAAEQEPVTMSVGGVHFGLLADRDLDPSLGAMRAALEDATNGRFAPPDRG
jgi:hypothetical protein